MAECDPKVIDLEVETSLASRASVHPVIGKIISDKVLNSEEVIPLIHKAWEGRTYGKVHITYLEDNLYYFSFERAASAEKAIQDGPWLVMGCFLCLQHWKASMNVKEVSLTHIPIWVQVHGLQLDQMTEQNVKLIANHIGEFIEMDQCSLNEALKRGFLRIKVLMDCYSIIKGGLRVRKHSETNYYIEFKYEQLADLCFKCGHFGHLKIECKEEDLPDQHFGPELKAAKASFGQFQPITEEQRRAKRKKRLNVLFILSMILLGIIFLVPIVVVPVGYLMVKPFIDIFTKGDLFKF